MSPEGRVHRGILRDCELPLSSNPSLRRFEDPLPPPRPLRRSPSTPGLREDGGRVGGALIGRPGEGHVWIRLCDLG